MSSEPGEIHWILAIPSEFKTIIKPIEGMEEPKFVVPIPKAKTFNNYIHIELWRITRGE